MALEVGSRLAHYDVTALIGEGGMGQVYRATDTKLNRQVAAKIGEDGMGEETWKLHAQRSLGASGKLLAGLRDSDWFF